MSEEALDLFGEFLMSKVRDKTIYDWDRILDGHMKTARTTRISQRMSGLSEDQQDFVRSVVAQVVNSTLHNLLWSLEEEKAINVAVDTPEGRVSDLARASDGFPGELYTKEGWIERFSQARKESFD